MISAVSDILLQNILNEANSTYNNALQERRNTRDAARILRQQIALDNQQHANNNKLKFTIINDTIECPICMEIKNNTVITKCNHKFCIDCIKEIKSDKCPYCRCT
jgi:hypothetical protein